jgi:glycosyltransferase involved in cell wall biosynthesis
VKISIVVPAFNEEKLIGASLRQIKSAAKAFLAKGWDIELIVCDNNSTDRTAELARVEGARVVFEPINQIARARNRGAQAAEGDWLVFVDADSHPGWGLFEEVAREIQTGSCLAGGCTVKMDEPGIFGGLLLRVWNCISRVNRWAAGSFIFCEAAAFGQIGGFNQELFVAEELDLSKRLKKLAKATSKRFVILHRHSIMTSARKLHLYSRMEYLRFLAQMILRPNQTVRQREACPHWYDGRR